MHERLFPQHDAVETYSRKQVLHLTRTAHEQATRLMDALAEHLRPGVTEARMRELYAELCPQFGVEKSWHRPYIFFGEHTLLTAHDVKPRHSRVLGEPDIAYIDIGPVIRVDGVDIEGDVGKTYLTGQDPLRQALQEASETLFWQARDFWAQTQPTGIELYRHIHRLTEEMGLVFFLKPAGHLIGSFPHKGWKDGLDIYPYVPEPGIWILEIQVRHPVEPVAAFYEAVLV